MLATKFFAPRWRRQQVSRPRLAARIDGDAKLVLLCAPPGFGKTTLLAEWLSGQEEPVAWLSLDSTHDDPRTFWAYLVRAMQTARPGLGEAVAAFLDAQTLPPIETLISMLLNEVVALKDELLVVLDDYHVIENAAIHDGMAFLIEQAPETLRIIIASRADPPFTFRVSVLAASLSRFGQPICGSPQKRPGRSSEARWEFDSRQSSFPRWRRARRDG